MPHSFAAHDLLSNSEVPGIDAGGHGGRPAGLRGARGRPAVHVVSCNSAWAWGSNASAWQPESNAGGAYATCPSNGGFTAGVSNRLTGQTYGGFSYSAHAFNAPPGTSITEIRWAGRRRRNCDWGAFMRAMPSRATVLGLPNGQYCKQDDIDFTNAPFTYTVPPGTTRLEQMVQCAAPSCSPGAAMHSHILEVTIDDPQAPSISLSGRMVSGQWVSGVAGNSPGCPGTASDSSGIQSVEATLETQHAVSRTPATGHSRSLVQASPR